MYYRNKIQKIEFLSPWKRLFSYIFSLKNLLRTGWVRYWDVPRQRCESVADHSFSTAIFALFLRTAYAPELDELTVLKTALLHDLGESIIGDIPVRESHVGKVEKERRAFSIITQGIDEGREVRKLWESFEKQNTPEARFVKDVDRLEFLFQRYFQWRHKIGDMKAHCDGKKRVVSKIKHPQLRLIAEEILGEIEGE